MNSILSFPTRGPEGDASWRGNCSGHVYRELFSQFKPRSFADPMMGSGTSIEVAQSLGIEAFGFDLHQGFDAVTESLLQRIGKPVDMVVSHPPYGGMILYSGVVWGEANAADLSRCTNDEQFIDGLTSALFNQREATTGNGIYGTIIGDWRRDGRYTSYQANLINRLPADELLAVIIKAQHGTLSGRRVYNNFQLPRIAHEYIVLWRKRQQSLFAILKNLATAQHRQLQGTWLIVVETALRELGGTSTLSRLYEFISQRAIDKLASNTHWQAKIRQILNQNRDRFRSIEVGVWQISPLGSHANQNSGYDL